MRVLKPGQEVTLSDDLAHPVEGRIRCVMIYEDMSVQYECRWWADGEPTCAAFFADELQEPDDAKYIEVEG